MRQGRVAREAASIPELLVCDLKSSLGHSLVSYQYSLLDPIYPSSLAQKKIKCLKRDFSRVTQKDVVWKACTFKFASVISEA